MWADRINATVLAGQKRQPLNSAFKVYVSDPIINVDMS